MQLYFTYAYNNKYRMLVGNCIPNNNNFSWHHGKGRASSEKDYGRS